MSNKNAFTLRIDSPCNEKWSDMNQSENGRICDSCKKEVIDFTKMSDRELINFLRTEKPCGRFRPDQLNKLIQEPKSSKKWISVAATSAAMLTGYSSQGQILPQPQFQTNESSDTNTRIILHEDSIQYVTFRGYILDSEYNEPVINVLVEVVGTSIRTVSNLDGMFELAIPETLVQEGFIIRAETMAYRSFKLEFEPNSDLENRHIEIKLEPAHEFLMGDVVIERPKKWWQFWK